MNNILNLKSVVILLMVLFVSSISLAQTNYYVSSSKGSDRNKGLSEAKPWASLKRVQKAKFVAGDTIHFKRGDLFAGQLVIGESGNDQLPITYTAYGEGPLPIIDGSAGKGGSHLSVILAEDQDHLEISYLAIRNFRKVHKENRADVNAYGLLIKNTGKRNLQGFEIHHLTVEEIYPIRAKRSFNETSVTGIRFETKPAKGKKRAFNTSDIYIHDNTIRHTSRFGIALRHRPSRIEGITGTSLDYDVNVRIINNRCEDLGGSCVLMNGVWQGLLEGNTFLRSGAMVEPKLSVNRGSGAWFFRSNHIVAQHNMAISSRGHNDSAGIHVDFANENILVQYNYFYDNEGYGTEILGKNKNVIWRYNVSVADGFRRIGVERPEGGKSQHPGKTIFVSNFSVPKRILSRDIYIYNNTYLIASNTDPFVEVNAVNAHLWNNVFSVEKNGRLGRKVNLGWEEGKAIDLRGNVYAGNISPNLIRLDTKPLVTNLTIQGDVDKPKSFAINTKQLLGKKYGVQINHPLFPAAGKGIFSHVSEVPTKDFFGNKLMANTLTVGAGYK